MVRSLDRTSLTDVVRERDDLPAEFAFKQQQGGLLRMHTSVSSHVTENAEASSAVFDWTNKSCVKMDDLNHNGHPGLRAQGRHTTYVSRRYDC